MSTHKQEIKRITTHQLREMKNRGEKIAMLTAYDFSMAKIIDGAGIDIILVGDSASNVMAGHETTLPITLDQMIYHAASVVRAVKRSLVIVDLPFGTYQGSSGEALRSSIRIMKESGAHAVKLEGGSEIKESVDRILSAGIPVMGHLGLTPQSIYKFGTYTVRAKEDHEANKLMEDAKMLEKCGCFGIVLEKIPATLAKAVSESISIPTIGIGAGPDADGQVLVMQDMFGISNEFEPLGAERTQKVEVRVIAATNRDLKQMVAEGKFQEDLYYRLNVIPIVLPPLRERPDDIPVLIDHFVEKHRQRTGKRIERVEPEVVDALKGYNWPGNVRELENTIERAVVLATGPIVTSSSISLLGATSSPSSGLPSPRLHQNIEWVERETIRRALQQSGGVKKDAAELMGISQRALSYYLAKYRID
jgi:3-methyl-2-oxobutanoate hydroxymethyltransferase